jgi:hypothetical protein
LDFSERLFLFARSTVDSVVIVFDVFDGNAEGRLLIGRVSLFESEFRVRLQTPFCLRRSFREGCRNWRKMMKLILIWSGFKCLNKCKEQNGYAFAEIWSDLIQAKFCKTWHTWPSELSCFGFIKIWLCKLKRWLIKAS